MARGWRLTVDLVVAHLDGLGNGGVDEGDKAEAARLHGVAVTNDVRVRDLAKLLLEVATQRVLRAVVREPAEEDLAWVDFVAHLLPAEELVGAAPRPIASPPTAASEAEPRAERC